MKKLKNYSEEIYKCTRCGLCQSVCPIFEETGLETAVSRGIFTLLHAVLNGNIKFTKKIAKYLDLCLGCRACFDFCPSGISAEEIILAARDESRMLNGISLVKKFIVAGFNSNFLLKNLQFVIWLYTKTFSHILPAFPLINKVNSQLRENVQYKKLSPVGKISLCKITYFPGCINTYINHSVQNSIRIVLERNGFSLSIPKDLSCCGIPARSAGDMDSFIRLAKCNLEKIDINSDYILTDCASCGSVWQIYAETLDGEFKEKAQILAKKAVNINKFLADIELYIPRNVKIESTVTYHDPCHLNRFQGVKEEPRVLLKKIPGLEFVEMKEADKCCGAAGSFCLINPDISRAVSRKKAQNIVETNAKIISTSCPSCKIGIFQGLNEINKQLPLYQPVELLAKLYLLEHNQA